MASLIEGFHFLPHIAYDSVVFGFSGMKLKILLMEYHQTGFFALPGGFVQRDESLDSAVQRGLKERTGLDHVYLEQFYTFGSLGRYQPEVMRSIMLAQGFETAQHMLFERFVSVGYYALINCELVNLRPDKFSDSIGWYELGELPDLILDHGFMVEKALEHLRMHLDHKLLSINLLPEFFTMKELQRVYEAILGEVVNRANFQRKILSLALLERHEKLFMGGSHKAPYLYSLKKNL